MTDTWWVKQGQLDKHQKNVFTLSIKDDHLVKGPPGSGKTNLLLLRGKQLIGSNIPDVVVVVHTRTLQEFIRSGAPNYGIPATKIVTFRKLATDLLYRVGASVTLPADFDKSRDVLVDALQAQIDADRIQQEYACVLVDEAQDFLPGEMDVLRSLGERFFGCGRLAPEDLQRSGLHQATGEDNQHGHAALPLPEWSPDLHRC